MDFTFYGCVLGVGMAPNNGFVSTQLSFRVFFVLWHKLYMLIRFYLLDGEIEEDDDGVEEDGENTQEKEVKRTDSKNLKGGMLY